MRKTRQNGLRFIGAGAMLALTVALLLVLARTANPQQPAAFRFAILGDRTGETVPGVYQAVWRAALAEHPAFAVSVGDTIQGLSDATARAQWEEVSQLLAPYRRIPLYLAPGNHDVWSAASAKLFEEYAKHPLHYSFDFRQAHFTILDNSRSDQLSEQELAFLEEDLRMHNKQQVKFIVSHRPSWIVSVALQNPNFELHRLAKQYGVRYVIAGHVHQMLRAELQGIEYVSVPSSGGHLRASGAYGDGWFFGHTRVDVRGADATFRVEELGPPHGSSRVTTPADWSLLGLASK